MVNRVRSAVLLAAIMVEGTGCGTVLDPAYVHMSQAAPGKAAEMWAPTTKRPSRSDIEVVQKYGRERFLRKMSRLLPYPLAIHAIGWFGDIWHLHTIAPYLQSDDAATRMVALGAFSRLSGEQFADTDAAVAWWELNRQDIPSPH